MPRPTNTQQSEKEALHQQGLRHCPDCAQDLPLAQFGAMKKDPYNLQIRCRECVNKKNRVVYAPRASPEATTRKRAWVKAWRANMDPAEKKAMNRRHNLKAGYNLTPDECDALLAKQGGCAVCGSIVPGGKGHFHVDHNHETGEVRGLLCHYCNVGLGHFKDSPIILQAAITYLLQFTSGQEPRIPSTVPGGASLPAYH